MMSKLGDGITDSKKDTPVKTVVDKGREEEEDKKEDKQKKKAGGISAKDIAKNPAMAKMFILAAKKFKAVQERERLEAEEEQKN